MSKEFVDVRGFQDWRYNSSADYDVFEKEYINLANQALASTCRFEVNKDYIEVFSGKPIVDDVLSVLRGLIVGNKVVSSVFNRFFGTDWQKSVPDFIDACSMATTEEDYMLCVIPSARVYENSAGDFLPIVPDIDNGKLKSVRSKVINGVIRLKRRGVFVETPVSDSKFSFMSALKVLGRVFNSMFEASAMRGSQKEIGGNSFPLYTFVVSMNGSQEVCYTDISPESAEALCEDLNYIELALNVTYFKSAGKTILVNHKDISSEFSLLDVDDVTMYSLSSTVEGTISGCSSGLESFESLFSGILRDTDALDSLSRTLKEYRERIGLRISPCSEA